jgi:hypothetical protein
MSSGELMMFGGLQTWLFWRDVKRRVAKHGWTIVHLGGDGRHGPVWAYSVGFWECAASPEVIVFGHDEIWSNGLISQVLKQIREGLVLRDLMTWRLEGFEGTWRRVDPLHIQHEEWFTCARRYKRERSGDEHLEAFQLFVPDEAGKYPWEDGFDEAWRRFQHELYLPTPQIGPGELADRGMV